jgi:hypothetical protein
MPIDTRRYTSVTDRPDLLLCRACSSRSTGHLIPAVEKRDHDAWHDANDVPTRHARIEGRGHADLDAVRRYLPSNYTADSDGGSIWIHGQDSLGWTLDGYVIPRLASGLYFAREVTA